MARTELFFGAGGVSRRNWADFVARVVTPRFPDGLTMLEGAGQWRGSKGLMREPARLMIILHAPGHADDRAIDAIRSAFRSRFRQQSVLRVDDEACAAF